MSFKSIEIYYDIADIPDIADRSGFSPEALEFRNEAMDHVENAIMEAGVGEWSGAEIGSGEVNFGFTVEDFDTAEAVVSDAIANTRFAGIREITRFEMTEDEVVTAGGV